MGRVLSGVHQACGEKPGDGQVFPCKGTDSAGVFFTIVNHAQDNKPMAGMVVAAQTGPNQFEAGLIADSADRFRQTVNPMLQQLYGAWHPGGTPAASTAAGGTGPAPTPSLMSGSPAPLHKVSAPDNSVSLSVPDGWAVQPNSGWGAIIVKGPTGEQVGLGMNKGAVDPTNAWQARMAAAHYSVVMPGSLVYPFRGDVARSSPTSCRHRASPAASVRRGSRSMPPSDADQSGQSLRPGLGRWTPMARACRRSST